MNEATPRRAGQVIALVVRVLVWLGAIAWFVYNAFRFDHLWAITESAPQQCAIAAYELFAVIVAYVVARAVDALSRAVEK